MPSTSTLPCPSCQDTLIFQGSCSLDLPVRGRCKDCESPKGKDTRWGGVCSPWCVSSWVIQILMGILLYARHSHRTSEHRHKPWSCSWSGYYRWDHQTPKSDTMWIHGRLCLSTGTEMRGSTAAITVLSLVLIWTTLFLKPNINNETSFSKSGHQTVCVCGGLQSRGSHPRPTVLDTMGCGPKICMFSQGSKES